MYILDKNGNIMTFKDAQGNVKSLEYRYLEYNQDGYVVTIYAEEPILTNGNKIAIADNVSFEPGYEFDNYILVQAVDEESKLTSSCMVKQPESVKFLRQENIQLKQQNTDLMLAIAEMAEATEQDKTDTQLAIAELAEVIAGGV